MPITEIRITGPASENLVSLLKVRRVAINKPVSKELKDEFQRY